MPQNPSGIPANDVVESIPNFVQGYLFQSSGVQFHFCFCENCPQPHWGLVASNSRSPTVSCPQGKPTTKAASLAQAVLVENPGLPLNSGRFVLGATGDLRDDLGAGYQPGRLSVGMNLRVLTLEPAVVFEGHSEPLVQNKKFQVIFFNLTFPNLSESGASQLSINFAIADRCQRAVIGDIINVREISQLTSARSDAELQVFGANTASDTVDIPLLMLCRRTT